MIVTNIGFSQKKLDGCYHKGMNPNEYEYVWGVKYKGYDNDNYWYKACFLNILDNKFTFLTSTDKFLDSNGAVPVKLARMNVETPWTMNLNFFFENSCNFFSNFCPINFQT
jgi:hypothetical protein